MVLISVSFIFRPFEFSSPITAGSTPIIKALDVISLLSPLLSSGVAASALWCQFTAAATDLKPFNDTNVGVPSTDVSNSSKVLDFTVTMNYEIVSDRRGI
ncbi:hypothetical protein BD779DRAFT_1435951 [Infundibulicybe gibba]|nr:hypothetical protein BD779DRAFT_1435951 [Infundibulicybe gibba]